MFARKLTNYLTRTGSLKWSQGKLQL